MDSPESIGSKNPGNVNPQPPRTASQHQSGEVNVRPAPRQEVGTEALKDHTFTNVKNTNNAAAKNIQQRMDNVFKNAPKVVFEK